MTHTRRAERIERQDDDDGDDDDTVFHRRAHSRGARATAYHETLDCSGVLSPEDYTETTRRAAQLRWLGPCQWCVLKSVEGKDLSEQATD